MNNDINKIKEYIDTRAILSFAEKEYVKRYIDDKTKSTKIESFEMLKAFVKGFAVALITDRLFAMEIDNTKSR